MVRLMETRSMTAPANDPLLLAGKAMTIVMQGVMAIGAAAVAVTLPFVTVLSGDFVKGFADGARLPIENLPAAPAAALLAILFVMLAALFVFFGKLRAIIATVGEGDPFVPANARRLERMAWLLLAVQALVWPALFCAAFLADWAKDVEGLNLDLTGDGISLTGLLMVLVLFILARVFRHGAAMRDDLEGTV